MNNNDQAQFAKDVYQVPYQGVDRFDTRVNDDASMNQQFANIAREETRIAFEEITKELAMVASGVELVNDTKAETFEMHPDAAHLLEIGNSVKAMRSKRHAELVEIQSKRGIGKIVSNLFAVNSFDSEKSKQTKEALLHDLIEQESKIGATIFPSDTDVLSRKFFYLPNESYDEWFHQQTSPNRTKDFTNSYIVTHYGIQKSSTYFDEVEGRVKNVSVQPADDEIRNLKHAATQYHTHVTKKVYAKPATSRRRFGLKSDFDLAA